MTASSLPPPDTLIVTLLPEGSDVPLAGDWLTTVPSGWVEFGSELTVTWKLAFCNVACARASLSPLTGGTV